MFDIKDVKKQALASLKGKWKTPILVQLFCVGIVAIFYAVIFGVMFTKFPAMEEENTFLPFMVVFLFVYYILLGIIVVVIPPLLMGEKRIYQQIAETGDKVPFKTFFSGFKCFGKSMGYYWWNYLWVWLWTLVFYVPFFFFIFIAMAFIGSELSYLFIPAVVLIVLSVISLIFMMILNIRKTIAYKFMWFAGLNDPQLNALQAMDVSKAITKGQIGKIFVLNLSFIGWILLGLLTLGIGLMWVDVYMQAANYYAYKVLVQKSIEETKPQNQIED